VGLADLTQADAHAARLDLKMTVSGARGASCVEREAVLRGWRYVGPHRSGEVRLSDEAVAHLLVWLRR
jgi:hypothetical protein